MPRNNSVSCSSCFFSVKFHRITINQTIFASVLLEFVSVACSPCRCPYPSGVIELRQDEEDVLLTRLQGAVLKAAVLQLVSQSEECWECDGGEASRDVGPPQVHLPLTRIQLLLTDVLQQLRAGKTTVHPFTRNHHAISHLTHLFYSLEDSEGHGQTDIKQNTHPKADSKHTVEFPTMCQMVSLIIGIPQHSQPLFKSDLSCSHHPNVMHLMIVDGDDIQ